MRASILALALAALGARAEAPERDDPRGRIESQQIVDGLRTPEEQLAILRAAESEARKYGMRPGIERFAAVAGTAWVNVGPSTADFEYNGAVYHKVDSGRARRIIVDPRNANVVYFATSGGGVWKTFDALTAIDATHGPHWQAITESIGSLSIGDLAMNPALPDSLLLGLGDPFDVHTPGLLHSDDGGVTWSSAVTLSGSYTGTAGVFIATTVRNIAFDPSTGNSNIVFAATDAGLFRSTEGGVGTNWQLIDLASTTHTPQDCWSVAYAGPRTWLAACIDATPGLTSGGGAVFRSTDDGVSWGSVTLTAGTVRRITLATASRALNGTDKGCMNGTAPASGWRAYALAANATNADQADVFCSDNGGSSWSSLGMTPAGRAPVNPTDDQTDLDFTHDQAFYNHMLVVDPLDPNSVFIGGNLSMGRSTDGGNSWNVMTDWLPFGLSVQTGGLSTALDSPQYAHADWHTATVAHFGTTAYFYGGNDGGLIRAVDLGGTGFLGGSPGTVSWEDKLNRGIVTHLIFSVATGKERGTTACTAASAPDIVYGGFQDNGTRMRVLSGGTNFIGFNQIAGGDGFGVGIGCVSGGAIGSNLISTYASLIRYSDPTTTCPVGLTPPCFATVVRSDGTGLTPPITLHPNYTFNMKIVTDLTADRTYLTPLTDTATCGHVYKSADGGHTWNAINGTITRLSTGGCAGTTRFPYPLKNLASDPLNANHYATVGISRVYVTVDGGTTWKETTRVSETASDYMAPQTVAFDPTDATGNTVWVGSKAASTAINGAAPTSHLFKSINALAGAAVVWVPVLPNTGLPNVPINVVKLDPGDHNAIYVGTEIGMYRSADGGTTFVRYGKGLPLVSVTDVSISADGSSLRIATYGRGFWEIYPNAAAPAGVFGSGDFDNSGVIDGYDLIREAAALLTDSTSADYNWVGNLVGTTNQIDAADLTVLIAKLGGRP
jgi:hypothetical protein